VCVDHVIDQPERLKIPERNKPMTLTPEIISRLNTLNIAAVLKARLDEQVQNAYARRLVDRLRRDLDQAVFETTVD
jgi:hypothetical protein